MENQTIITKKELDEFKEKLDNTIRQIEGIKSTIEILQDKEMMQDIRETEEAIRKGEVLEKVNF